MILCAFIYYYVFVAAVTFCNQNALFTDLTPFSSDREMQKFHHVGK